AVAKDQLDVFRLDPLNGGDLLGVDAALQHSRRLRLPGELGVGDLVAEGAELAGPVDPQQEVGVTPPAAIEEGPLVDDVDTLAHGRDGLGKRLAAAGDRTLGKGTLDYSPVASSEVGKMPGFVLKASTGQDVEVRVLP